MSRIFISHSSTNNPAALAIGRWLQESGWDDYFLDVEPARGLSPGERWQEALKAAADRCEVVVFLISPAWLRSRWCLAEFLLAKQLGKRIFGVLVESVALDLLPKEMIGEWQLCDLQSGDEKRTFHVALDPFVPPTDVVFANDGLRRFELGLHKAGLNAATFPWPPENDPTRSPYRGLKALEPEDAAVFFGRSAAIVRGLDTLRAQRDRDVEGMLVILGASGSGKSSFLRAGLWPRLMRDDRNFLPLPVIRPERTVITGSAGLAAALETSLGRLGPPTTRGAVRQRLLKAGGFDSVIADLQARAQLRLGPDAASPTVVIPIDQAEELYEAEGRSEADEFLALLGEVLGSRETHEGSGASARRRVLAVVAIRSESYARLQTDGRLVAVKPSLFSLPPLSRGEFKAVIEGPAERTTVAGRRLILEPALTERLLEEAEGADALPLLSFTLERLFVNYGADGDLRLDEYIQLGGLRGAIEAAIEEAFKDTFKDGDVQTDRVERERKLRQAFVPWLAAIDPETEERRRRVARWDEIPAESRPSLERMIERRLLIRDRRKIVGGEDEVVVVEVAHEALLRQWSALVRWLDEDVAALKAVEGLKRAAAEWAKNSRGVSWLVHSGDRLSFGQRLRVRPELDQLLGDKGREYLVACIAREEQTRAEREAQQRRIAEQQRRVAEEQARTARAQRRGRISLTVGAFFLLVSGTWIVLQARDVGRQRSIILSSAAERSAQEGRLDRALRLGILADQQGWLSPKADEADAVLARAVYASKSLVGFSGHEDAVVAAVFSPDGERVVTASSDKTARIWNARTGKAIVSLVGHADPVSTAVFSPDGERVVTASSDKTARIWDARTGKPIVSLVGHGGYVFLATFSPDGAWVLTASSDKTARVWDARTGKQEASLRSDQWLTDAAFSPSGEWIVTASWDKTARIWDARTGREIVKLVCPEWVMDVAFSPDGKRVATASGDTSSVWDAQTGVEVARLKGHRSIVTGVAFSPNSDRVLTASADGTARMWNADTGEESSRFSGHGDAVVKAVFSPDGERIVTASRDKTARLWGAETGRELARFSDHGTEIVTATFSPDGERVLTASKDKMARIWDARTGTGVTSLVGHESGVAAAGFSSDGTRVLTASWDRTARVWDVRTGKEKARLSGHADSVDVAVFSPDDQRVLTASKDKTARIWDAKTGKELVRLEGHKGWVKAAFSPDGERVVTASWDRTARVWDAKTGKELARLLGHENLIAAVAFSPDGERVLTASSDKTARVWDAKTGEEVARLIGHEDELETGVFSPDGKRVLTASRDKTARVWDAKTGKEVARLAGHESAILVAAFSPDGYRVVTASLDETARVWDTKTGQELARLAGHEKAVVAAVFSPTGKHVLTGSDDLTARVWDAKTGKEVARFSSHTKGLMAVAFSPNGERLLTASQDGTVGLWDSGLLEYSSTQLVDHACSQQLVGMTTLTNKDVSYAILPQSRIGQNVCAATTGVLHW